MAGIRTRCQGLNGSLRRRRAGGRRRRRRTRSRHGRAPRSPSSGSRHGHFCPQARNGTPLHLRRNVGSIRYFVRMTRVSAWIRSPSPGGRLRDHCAHARLASGTWPNSGTRTGIRAQSGRTPLTASSGKRRMGSRSRPRGVSDVRQTATSGAMNWVHIDPGSHADNMVDRRDHGRDPIGSAHGKAVLDEADVAQICELLAGGAAARAGARQYGVSATTVGWRS